MIARVFAPAKINLTLQVGAPRVDGLHPLQSAVAFASVGDWIEARASAALMLEIDGPFGADLSTDRDNLVLRAAYELARAAGIDARARLRLIKELPVASGVGGGSSDAAAALKALNAIWGMQWDETRLAEVARELGADVPACVSARSAYMTGAGEVIEPIAIPELYALLVNPLKPLPTVEVYRRFDAMGMGKLLNTSPAPVWRTAEDVWASVAAIGNDLEPAASALMPEIAEIGALLRGDPRVRVASLSGSGATMFALVESYEDARALAADVARTHPSCWSRACVLGESGLDAPGARG